MKRVLHGVIPGLLLVMGCSKDVHQIDTVFESAQCGRQLASSALERLTSAGALDQAIEGINRHKISGDQLIGGPFSSAPESAPVVDFAASEALLIEMGRRPTAGYRLTLADTSLAIRDGVAQVLVNWEEPGPSAVVTQVMTSPCLIVTVPRARYRELVVVDQLGQPRARLKRK